MRANVFVLTPIEYSNVLINNARWTTTSILVLGGVTLGLGDFFRVGFESFHKACRRTLPPSVFRLMAVRKHDIILHPRIPKSRFWRIYARAPARAATLLEILSQLTLVLQCTTKSYRVASSQAHAGGRYDFRWGLRLSVPWQRSWTGSVAIFRIIFVILFEQLNCFRKTIQHTKIVYKKRQWHYIILKMNEANRIVVNALKWSGFSSLFAAYPRVVLSKATWILFFGRVRNL